MPRTDVKVINPFDGRRVKIGGLFAVPHQRAPSQLVAVKVIDHEGYAVVHRPDNTLQVIPLIVRWMHPLFPFQEVAFLPT